MKILIVEDNKDFLAIAEHEMLSLQVDRGWSFTIAQNIESAIHFINCAEFDLVLLDLMLPDGNGRDFLLELQKKEKILPSIVISVLTDPVSVLNCIKLGAVGYVDKTDFLDETQTIESVVTAFLNKQAPITGTIAKLILESLHKSPVLKSEYDADLSPREIEVLKLLSKGFTMKEVAKFLNISHHTVPVHARNIYKKLNVNGKVEALVAARESGLLD